MGKVAPENPALPERPWGYHALGARCPIRAFDCVCRHGARSPRLTGAHANARIGVIFSGAFRARSSLGAALVGPGTLSLSNPGMEYEYSHVDDGGDRSIVFDYEPAAMAEIADQSGARGGRPFRAASVPPSAATAEAVTLAHEALRCGDPDAVREAAMTVAAIAFAAGGAPAAAPDGRRAQRISQVLRHIEADYASDCSLDALAARAGLSSFHFLRLFRAATGQTPRQYVIATRLRAAALAIRTTAAPITDVAFDTGFGDLSHFHASFADAFGTSPRAYRNRALRR